MIVKWPSLTLKKENEEIFFFKDLIFGFVSFVISPVQEHTRPWSWRSCRWWNGKLEPPDRDFPPEISRSNPHQPKCSANKEQKYLKYIKFTRYALGKTIFFWPSYVNSTDIWCKNSFWPRNRYLYLFENVPLIHFH